MPEHTKEPQRQFAKLYETERGQIVVMREAGDYGPEIGFYFDAGVPLLATSRIGIGFGDGDDANEKADLAFEKIHEEEVKRVVFHEIDQIAEMFKEGA